MGPKNLHFYQLPSNVEATGLGTTLWEPLHCMITSLLGRQSLVHRLWTLTVLPKNGHSAWNTSLPRDMEPHSLGLAVTLCGNIFPCFRLSSLLKACASYDTWPTTAVSVLYKEEDKMPQNSFYCGIRGGPHRKVALYGPSGETSCWLWGTCIYHWNCSCSVSFT